MRTTQQLSITLPLEMAELVRKKVESGDYATESEVIREGLRALQLRDEAVEKWLREEVVPIARAMKADPSIGIPIEQVRANLAARRKARSR
jgi:antitoxin ParD1/3/4